MNKLIIGIFALCSFGITNSATASEGSGVYVYGAAGQSTNSTITNGSQEAYLLFLGYQINRKWAIEGGYADIGTSDYSGNVTVGGVTGTANLSTKSSATSLTAVRTWLVPDNNSRNAFSILAKFGLAQVKSSATGTISIPTVFSATDSYTKRGLTFGLGAKYEFDDNLSLRVDADSFDTGKNIYGRVPVFSLGLSYEF